MKRKSSKCREPTESSRWMRGAGKGIYEYILELLSEAADGLCVGDDGCIRYHAEVW